MTRRTFSAWCYLGTRRGHVEDLAQEVLNNPEENFMFSDNGDKSKVRRAIEDALRKTATDRQMIEIARMLELI